MRTPQIGDRVRMAGVMPNDPDPIPVGDAGTIDWVTQYQYGVKWDSGRTLMLLPDDPFEVLATGQQQCPS